MDLVSELLTDYTLRTVALGSALLGMVSGALGTFAVLRRQSLLGDAISHAALPGIALAFLLSGSKAPLVLLLGAALAGWAATGLIMAVTSATRTKYDSALSLMLSVFFGVGLVVLTAMQKLPNAQQAGLDTFLFGQAASMIARDVAAMAGLGAAALLVTGLLWKEFKLLAFDREFGSSLGMPMRGLDVALTSLIVVAIVVGLQTVGVVLMSAMLIAPAAAARQWTDRLGLMVLIAVAFGAVAGVTGALVSSSASRLPTGPIIVLCAGSVVVLSLGLAPNRGIIWRALRRYRSGLRLGREALLLDLYALALQHEERKHPHPEAALAAMRPGAGRLRARLRRLREKGYVESVTRSEWMLTDLGISEAQQLHRSRTVQPDRRP